MGEALKKRVKQIKFSSRAQEALINLLIAAGYMRDRLDAVCEEFGITHGQYNVLRILRGAKVNGYSRLQISERMIEKAPDVTRLVDRLEKQGLVERTRSDEDKRESITKITQKGLELLLQIDPRIKKVHEHFEFKVKLENCGRLTDLCERIYSEE